MRLVIVTILLVFAFACKSARDSFLVYNGVSSKYYVQGNIINGKEKAIFSFYDLKDPSKLVQTGFYLDGFRNDYWYYYTDALTKVKWAHYKDKSLLFETNVLTEIDSIQHGEYFSILNFKTNTGFLRLTVSVNGPLKDSSRENFQQIFKSEFNALNCDVLDFSSDELSNNSSRLYAYQMTVFNRKSESKTYIKNIHAFNSKNDLVDIAVHHSLDQDFLAQMLLDAVVNNFFIRGERLVYPFEEKKR